MLELGGSDPFIVLKSDDLDATVASAVEARLGNTGQACNAGKRFIVVDDLYEPFLEKFTAAMTVAKPGDPTSPDTTVGPLSSATATIVCRIRSGAPSSRAQSSWPAATTTATSSSRP